MPLFSAAQLAMMQGVQERHMQDEGWVYTYDPTAVNAYNLPVAAYTKASRATVCGFEPTANEVQRSGEVGTIDGKLRLPLDTAINEHDLFLLTKRYGVALTDTSVINDEAVTGQLYSVFGPPERGPSGLVVNLKSVTE